VTAVTGARQSACDTAVIGTNVQASPSLLPDQEDTMKANSKLTIAAFVVLTAMAVHTLHAQTIGPMSSVRDGDAAGSTRSKTYADWQGPLTQSFGIRFLAQRTAWDPIAGAPPSRGFTLQIFDGLEKMQVWRDIP
jgi:hypothetical protein